MTNDIKQRIEKIKNGKVPEGYHYSRAGISPNDWGKGVLSDVLYNEQRVIPKPKEGYWRLGIRSHAKGTFHEYVENPETVDMDELYVVRENDLILNITFAWEHAVALADKDDEGLLVSHRFPTYVFREGQNPIFYKSVAVQKRFKEMLALISPGGAGRNRVMSKKDFLRLPCNIPSCEEQQKIAEILMQCDKVIELKQKHIEEEKKLKIALMQKLLNPDSGIRLPGFKGEWKKTCIGDITELYSGGTPKSSEMENYADESGIPFIRSGEISATYTELFLSEIGYKNSSAKMVKKGDLLYALYGANSGDCFISKMNGAINQAILCIKSKSEDIRYIYYVLSNSREKITSVYLQGGQGNLSATIIKKIKIDLPSLEEQTAIVSALSSMDTIIENLEKELEQWQQKKKSLMQLLLTGIVRCKV